MRRNIVIQNFGIFSILGRIGTGSRIRIHFSTKRIRGSGSMDPDQNETASQHWPEYQDLKSPLNRTFLAVFIDQSYCTVLINQFY